MSSTSAGELDRIAARFPAGIDVIAGALDRHTFVATRAVAIAAGSIDRTLLLARYPSAHRVTLVGPTNDRDVELADALSQLGEATWLVLAPLDPLGDLGNIGAVARVAERLRAPDGCPWDREQTHASLRANLLEETYEALDALDAGDMAKLADELGDLLFQIAIHAQLAHEEGAFDLGDVSRRIGEKLIRRHPHVFGDAPTPVASTSELLVQWERIKRDEQKEERSLLDGIPRSLPALFAAERLQERAARLGLAPARVQLPLDVDDAAFLGDVLFDLVGDARDRGFDAEAALRDANARYSGRVKRLEVRARARGRELESYSADELRKMWEEEA